MRDYSLVNPDINFLCRKIMNRHLDKQVKSRYLIKYQGGIKIKLRNEKLIKKIYCATF